MSPNEPKNNKPVETVLVSYHQFMLEVVKYIYIYNLWGLPWVFFYFYASFFEEKDTQDFET